jgi:predicted ATP-grasp superfamily ATP-dependent carboligase
MNKSIKNVLVFPCGSEIGLEVNRALANSPQFKLFGGGNLEDHGKHVYKNLISELPYMEEPAFLEGLIHVIDRYKIDFIIPTHDYVVLLLAENQERLKATVLTAPVETCRVCRSKKKTYELFNGLVPTPAVYSANEPMSFPIFLKPEVGQGTKGTYTAYSEEEISFYRKKDSSLLILEYLPGKEYTIDCFTNKDKQLLFCMGRERIRRLNGISTVSKEVRNPRFLELAKKISDKLEFRGVWFFQLKERANGELALLEIAPRLAGTAEFTRVSGVNLIELSLLDRMGEEVSIVNNHVEFEINKALFARFSSDLQQTYKRVYVGFDGCLVTEGNVNTDLIKFLYQARNEQKAITLLVRGQEDIVGTLSKYAISEKLFDKIVALNNTESVTEHLSVKESVFIDSSRAQRNFVSTELQIPVFAPDAIAGLLNWKV